MHPTIEIFHQTVRLYDVFNQAMTPIAFLFNLLFFTNIKKKYLCAGFETLSYRQKNYSSGLSACWGNRKFCAVAETVLLTLPQGLSLLIFNRMFGRLLTDGNANYFGNIVMFPFVFLAFCLLLGADWLENLDLYTLTLPLLLSVSKTGCFFHGCCAGIETARFGLYNYEYDKVMFPVQLAEAGLALLIFAVLVLLGKKLKKGRVFPLYVILYSSTRFFSEFLRYEPPVLAFLKKYQILCIIGVLLGVTEWLLAAKFGDKYTRAYQACRERYLERKKAEYAKKYTPKPQKHRR